ncbi:reverse transcriptase domain-containing protein, partial [Tanacetum coccineum]
YRYRGASLPIQLPCKEVNYGRNIDKFIDEGRREHEEMEIFIKEFRTTNELFQRSDNQGRKMTSEATCSKEINETGINKNEPPRFEQDVQEKPHDDGEENKSSSIHEMTTHPLVKPQQSSIPFPNRVRKEKEEALQRNFLENLKQLDINILFIEALLQIPKYAKYLKSLLEKHKEAEYLAADHLSRFEKPHMEVLTERKIADKFSSEFEKPHMEVLTERKIADKFSSEYLMVLKSKSNNDEPWFGVLKALISDRGTRFCNSHLEKALQRYGVTHKLSTVYHPQSNGRTKVTNRAIKCILERSVGYNPKGWSEKLNDALWAFRTAYKTPTGCTPFRLVYGEACHLPVEIEHKAHWALKQCNLDLTLASKIHLMQLNELAN